jgi:2-phospho-L-lactate guanylyltransferase
VRRVTDLVMTVKALDRAKSRLLGAADRGVGDRAAHSELVLALVRDTVAAAAAAEGVRRLLMVTSSVEIARMLAADGVATVPDQPDRGLNEALAHGAAALLADDLDGNTAIAVLQSDLPALNPAELTAALAEADGRRAFVADRQGTGTTLLVAAPGTALRPRFGPGSALAHTGTGALAITAALPSLRCDVDTADDLAEAAGLGLGQHTAALLGAPTCR